MTGIAAKGLSLILPLAFLSVARAAAGVVFLAAACDAFLFAMLGPYIDSPVFVSIPPDERAHVNSMLAAAILLASAPIAWLPGLLAEQSRALPLLRGVLFVAAEAVVAVLLGRRER